jgi:transposase
MIGVCDIQGFVKEACEVIHTTGHGEDVGTINRERFELWVEEKLLPVLGDYALGESRSLVVMDNATIHHSDNIIHLIESRGAKLVYLPPYSPDLNPIELCFAQYKKANQRLSLTHDWVLTHLKSLDSVTAEAARNMFRHCHVYVPMAEDLNELQAKKKRKIMLVAFLAVTIIFNNNTMIE